MSAIEQYYNIPESELIGFEREESEDCLGSRFIGAALNQEDPNYQAWAMNQLDYRGARIEQLKLELKALELKNKAIRDLMDAEEKLIADKIDWHNRAIIQILPPAKDSTFVGERVRLYYKETVSTDIYDPDSVPIDYCTTVTAPSKAKIKEALEAGSEEIPGAKLVTKFSLQIKPGGERGKTNARSKEKRDTKKLIEEATTPQF